MLAVFFCCVFGLKCYTKNMGKADVKRLMKYWELTAEHDYETMMDLFKLKRYSDCLFFAHIVLEKLLKGLVVRETKKQAKYTHNLGVLAEDSRISFTREQLEFFEIVNKFNIRARYPDEKLSFYKTCTRSYALKYLKKVEITYKFLCQEFKK